MTNKQKTIEAGRQIEAQNFTGVSDEVLSATNTTRENTLEVLLDKLISHFEARKHLYRVRQVIAFEQLIKHLQEGNNEGLIKLPMGTGKTFLFAEIAKALGLPTIILVPRVGLVYDTKEEMVGSDKKLGVGFKDNEVYTISSKETGTSSEKLQKILDENGGKFEGVLVTTYASLNSLRRTSPELFNILIECCGFIVSDEAHRSLGEQTKETGDELFTGEIGDDAKKAERELEEVLEDSFKGKIHLFTTATPTLIEKDVRDNVSTIYSSTIQEVADDGDLIIPKRVSVGKSFLYIERSNEENQRFNLTEADLGGPLDKYRDIDGKPLYETLSNKYVEEKEKAGGYLPGVGFCTTVNQAEFVTEYLKSIGVRAVRCTSDKPGVSKSVSDTEAKRMLENDEIDVVVTCTKVGEGWDVPTLRASIWYTPTQSPVKNLQGNGRIMRTVSEHLADIYREAMGGAYMEKDANNTMIIEPESWEVVAFDGDQFNVKEGGGFGKIMEGVGSLKTISGSHEMMYEVGELSKEYLDGEGIDLVKGYEINRMSQEELVQFHKQQLEEIGICDMNGLMTLGAYEYRNQFGKITIQKVLNQGLTYANNQKLEELGIALGFERWDVIQSHKKQLEEIGVTNMDGLLGLSPKDYRIQFGQTILRKILNRKISNVTLKELEKLGDALGFERRDTIQRHRQELADLGIIDIDGLLELGSVKYQQEFGKNMIQKILGEKFSYPNLERLEELGDALGFERRDTIQEHRQELADLGIIDMDGLLELGSTTYNNQFGKVMIQKILGQKIPDITNKKLQELGVVLGFEQVKLMEDMSINEIVKNHKKQLEKIGITDMDGLLELGPARYDKNFGVTLISRILGYTVLYSKIKYLKELGIELGLKRRDYSQGFRKELEKLGIIDIDGLLELSPKEYRRLFGKVMIQKILGQKIPDVTNKKLEELGEELFGKDKN